MTRLKSLALIEFFDSMRIGNGIRKPQISPLELLPRASGWEWVTWLVFTRGKLILGEGG